MNNFLSLYHKDGNVADEYFEDLLLEVYMDCLYDIKEEMLIEDKLQMFDLIPDLLTIQVSMEQKLCVDYEKKYYSYTHKKYYDSTNTDFNVIHILLNALNLEFVTADDDLANPLTNQF